MTWLDRWYPTLLAFVLVLLAGWSQQLGWREELTIAQRLETQSMLRLDNCEAMAKQQRTALEQTVATMKASLPTMEGLTRRLDQLDERLALLDPKGDRVLRLQGEMDTLLSAITEGGKR